MKQLILINLSLITVTRLFAQNSQPGCIIVKSVELYMNTSFRVQCDNFEKAFGELITSRRILAKDSLEIFSALVRSAKFAKKTENIDVRRKFLFKSGDLNTDIICSDGTNISLNGKIIKKNRRFIAFLNSIAGDSITVKSQR